MLKVAMTAAILMAMLPLFSATAHAQSATPARTIGLGDPSRAQLLDALRTVIARDLGQPVKFLVEQMHVQAGWAFIVAHPQTPAGAAIDFSKTHYAERQAEGGAGWGHALCVASAARGQVDRGGLHDRADRCGLDGLAGYLSHAGGADPAIGG